VQLGAQDAEDHHLHGISYLSQRDVKGVDIREKVYLEPLRILTHDSPVRIEIFQ